MFLAGTVRAAIVTPPALQGPYPVGCSSVEQDFSRLVAGEAASDYWSGVPSGAAGDRYVTRLQVAGAERLNFTLQVPTRQQNDLWDKQAGKRINYAAILCYPTTGSNNRADYALPNGARVPRMERGSDAPLPAGNPASTDGRWPLIVLSHGLGGSPLGVEYLAVIERLAQEGYVVYAPFHGDARFSRTKVEDFGDIWFLLSSYGEVAEMQALRALSLKAGLDALLARVEYAAMIDPDQIVGFGASLGGMGMMLVQGAEITASWSGRSRPVVRDERYKAVVGYVPFSGYPFLAAFGEGNRGVRDVRTPYLGIGGSADLVAPIDRTRQMIDRLAGHRTFVVIDGMPHGLRKEDLPELFGWTFAFYRAMLSRDPAVIAAFYAMREVPGGSVDRVVTQRALAWGSRDEAEAVEYVSDLGKFFFTARPDEIALLDALPTLWRRTGQRFVVFRADAQVGQPMCRIRAYDGGAINTHFHSTSASDCALLLTQPWARGEGDVLRAETPVGGSCPGDMIEIHRFFHPRLINHRYLPKSAVTSTQPGSGWDAEGAVFCAFRVPGAP
ncbi:MAG: alpha/beta hydrolase family protein [Casimicrobiaceae bacterium]